MNTNQAPRWHVNLAYFASAKHARYGKFHRALTALNSLNVSPYVTEEELRTARLRPSEATKLGIIFRSPHPIRIPKSTRNFDLLNPRNRQILDPIVDFVSPRFGPLSYLSELVKCSSSEAELTYISTTKSLFIISTLGSRFKLRPGRWIVPTKYWRISSLLLKRSRHWKFLSIDESRQILVKNLIINQIKKSSIANWYDIGCGTGRLALSLAPSLKHVQITGVDPLARARHKFKNLRFISRKFQNLGKISSNSLVTSLECIEHLNSQDLKFFERQIFSTWSPREVVVTTPNKSINLRPKLMPGLVTRDSLRHPDHCFEFTFSEFRAWSERISKKYLYSVSFSGFGNHFEPWGFPSSLAHFKNLDTGLASLNQSQRLAVRDQIWRILKRFGHNVHSIYLNGSRVRQDYIPCSDIDLTVIFKKKPPHLGRHEFNRISKFGIEKYKCLVDTAGITLWQLQRFGFPNFYSQFQLLLGPELNFRIMAPEKSSYVRRAARHTIQLLKQLNGSHNVSQTVTPPDPNDPFLGYATTPIITDNGKPRFGFKELDNTLGRIANVLIVKKSSIHCATRLQRAQMTSRHVGRKWGLLLTEFHRFVRKRNSYLIPTTQYEIDLMRKLCRKALDFQNYFLKEIHREGKNI